MSNTYWQRDAACRGSEDLFFEDQDAAKAICATCPVMDICRQWALESRQAFGVWGGLSEKDRKRIYKRVYNQPGMSLAEAAAQVARGSHSMADMFAARTEVGADGHTRWLVKSTALAVEGRTWTPRQMAFVLSHGREPEGIVRAFCGTAGCVTASHLTDGQLRRQRDREPAGEPAPVTT